MSFKSAIAGFNLWIKSIGWFEKLGLAAPVAAAIGIIFFCGWIYGNNNANVAINNYVEQHQVQQHDIQTKTAQVTTQVVTKYVDVIKKVKGDTVTNVQVVEKYVPDTSSELSNGWVYSYSSSLNGGTIDSSLAADATSSGITPTTALETITENNGICEENRQQLIALQSWINHENAIIQQENGASNDRN